MIGKLVSHYRIINEIGRGGMGVVYKAEDTKLRRTVALKFLPPELSRDPEAKERFFHEARAAAALEHANIATVYEIDEAEGQIFIALGYIEGRTLKDMIYGVGADLRVCPEPNGNLKKGEHKGSPLRINTAIDLAMQMAEGLALAHEKGIVHRDVKSANIMITDKGQVKIMDFGLAKLKGQTKLTREGSTMGTVAYMSPEQAQGKEVDPRSDIWSLGVVLYEMLTGKLPFPGEYDQAVIYAILNEAPEPVTALRSGIPLELERIIEKALAKDPAERYQGCQDLLADLRRSMKESKPAAAGRGATAGLRQRHLPWAWLSLIKAYIRFGRQGIATRSSSPKGFHSQRRPPLQLDKSDASSLPWGMLSKTLGDIHIHLLGPARRKLSGKNHPFRYKHRSHLPSAKTHIHSV